MSYPLSDDERATLDRVFELAMHVSSSGRAARCLLCAWQAPKEFGGLALPDLWAFDHQNMRTVIKALALIVERRGLRPDEMTDYAPRMEAVMVLHRQQIAREKDRW